MSTPTLSPTSTVVSSPSPRFITLSRQQQRHCCPAPRKLTSAASASTATSPVHALVGSPNIINVEHLASALASSLNLATSDRHDKVSPSTNSASSSHCQSEKSGCEKIPQLHRTPSMSGPPSPPDSETDRISRAGGVAPLPPLIKPRRKLNRVAHRRLSLNQYRQRSLPPPPPPPPTATNVTGTPPATPKQQPAEVVEAPVSDTEVVEVRTSKKFQGKQKSRRVVLRRLPVLAHVLPGRHGLPWQESVCCLEPLGSCLGDQAPGSSFCKDHTCRGVNEDHTECTNPVRDPRKSFYCAEGYHHENDRFTTLYKAVLKGKERTLMRNTERDAELASAEAWFDARFGAALDSQGNGHVTATQTASAPISRHHSRLDLAWGPYSTGQDRYWQGEWKGPWSLSPIPFRPPSTRAALVPRRIDSVRSA